MPPESKLSNLSLGGLAERERPPGKMRQSAQDNGTSRQLELFLPTLAEMNK